MKVWAFLLPTALALLIAGCSSATESSDPFVYNPDPNAPAYQPGPSSLRESPITFTLDVPAAVRVGEPVPLRLTLRNAGDRSFAFETDEPNTTFDFVVRGMDGTLIWWLNDAVIDIAHGYDLAPGQTIVYEAVWDQRRKRGDQMPAGTYQVFATHVNNLGVGPPLEPGMWTRYRTAPETLTVHP